MKKIIFILAIIVFIPSITFAWNDCPYGEVNEAYPGTCGRYTDTNHDGICDHSQDAPKSIEESAKKELISTVSANSLKNNKHKQQGNYHLWQITVFLLFLYIITRTLWKKKFITMVQHKKFWNILLLISFLISGILGILLIIRINRGENFSLPFDMLFWHVEIGIVMFIISIIHTLEHLNYFKHIFKK
jgi:hypothetical protein